VATILSAQCTDKQVNLVHARSFQKNPDARAYAEAPAADLENDIRSTGFFRNKARSIQGAARVILADYGGHVPDTMDGLLTLPGVARKTANIVLSHAFHKAEGSPWMFTSSASPAGWA
jgi:endonuclease-3